VLPTVGFPVVQFNPVQQPVIAYGIVPIGVSGQSEDRTFAGSARQAKAAIQISGSNFPIGGRQCRGSGHTVISPIWGMFRSFTYGHNAAVADSHDRRVTGSPVQ